MKQRILVVEDEPSILDNILYSLETEGFIAEGHTTGEAALERIANGEYALVVLDIGLPDVSGFELCKQIRQNSDIPIIFLTARAAEIDRIVGLEIGADDYVVKPFSPRELCARVKAVLRRFEVGPALAANEDNEPAHSTPLRIDEERAKIQYFNEGLTVSSTEFRLLRIFCQHPGRVYSRAQLMNIAWDEPDAAMERTVDSHIKSLRSKMKQVRDDVDPIETHRGLGYSLKEIW
jgi:two-component system catabolic regulation response regulator CreB